MALPPLPEPFEPTRKALHGFARVLGEMTRAHATPRSHWWHLGLAVRPDGLTTDAIPRPDGGTIRLCLDPAGARVEATSSGDEPRIFDLQHLDPTGLAAAIGGYAAEIGLPFDADPARIPEGPVEPDWGVAADYREVLVAVAGVLERRRAALDDPGPLVVWPHGFDLAFEWFGTRQVAGEDGKPAPAQLNLGFSPDDGGYFYSNPWPFDEVLTANPLPAGARWQVDGWKGTILPYAEVAGRDGGDDLVLEYAATVHRVARPTLDS